MTDTAKLFSRLTNLRYPPEMLAVSGEIKGTAFFPGGTGLLDEEAVVANKPVMILGQDFDCEVNYRKSLANGREDIEKNATWRNLLLFLGRVGVAPTDCFFTNAIMGVRRGDKGIGKSPAFKSRQFIKQCQDFFLYQVEIQRPKIILVLGKYTAEFLAPTAERLSDWQKIKNFAAVDEAGAQVKEQVVFHNGITASLALLTHPSFRSSNVHRRSFKGFDGCPAEVRMVQTIL